MINKSEQEIMSLWKGDNSKPLVSICSLTYNHEEYIMNALDSFLMQETDFPFEILIHDDASTDNTANIIKEYEKKFPSIIKPIYQTENKYSKGIRPSLFIFEKVQGEFIAICEADDYWCDPFKLKKQITLLKQYPKINFSFHSSIRHDIIEDTKTTTGNISRVLDNLGEDAFNKNSSNKDSMYGYIKNSQFHNYYGIIAPIENIILKTFFNYIETSSYVIRSTVLPDIIKLFKEHPYLPIGDFYIEILASYPNGALFINNTMSVYRLNSTSTAWTTKNNANEILHYNRFIPTLKLMDKFTNYKYTNTFSNYFYKRMYTVYCRPLVNSFWYESYNEVLQELITELKNSDLDYILYGYGTIGKKIYKNMENQIVHIVDKYLEKKDMDIPEKFLDFDELKNSDKKIIISSISATEEVIVNLKKIGINENKTINFFKLFPHYSSIIDKYEASKNNF